MIKGTKRVGRLVFGLALVAVVLPSPPRVVLADHALPLLDPSQVDYDPLGFYGPPG